MLKNKSPKFLQSDTQAKKVNNLDFESKAMHVGMIDHVGMEVGDIAQISALGFPKAEADAPLVKLGIASVDRTKPVIMCYRPQRYALSRNYRLRKRNKV